jgi:hypothetical protein
MTAPLDDGGGLYLRKRDASLTWGAAPHGPGERFPAMASAVSRQSFRDVPHKSLADARQEAHRLWTTRSGGVDPERSVAARSKPASGSEGPGRATVGVTLVLSWAPCRQSER